MAKNRIRHLAKGVQSKPLIAQQVHHARAHIRWKLEGEIAEKPVMKLDDDVAAANRKMEEMEGIAALLPGLDCGSCGSPSCRTLAEDIVRGNAKDLDCIFRLREKVKRLAQEMIELSDKMPIGSEGDKKHP